MPTSTVSSLRTSYPHGHLFGPWEDHPAKSHQSRQERRSRSGRDSARRTAEPLRVSVYGGSQGRGDAAQQVATVRETLLARLDDIGATSLWPIAEACGLSWDAWLACYQRMLLALFPVECGDGEEYTPDPAGRLDVPPAGAKVRKGGLFPYPCEGVGDERSLAFARHLLRGQGSPVSGLRTADGSPLFDAGDLARLGERQERRAGR